MFMAPEPEDQLLDSWSEKDLICVFEGRFTFLPLGNFLQTIGIQHPWEEESICWKDGIQK